MFGTEIEGNLSPKIWRGHLKSESPELKIAQDCQPFRPALLFLKKIPKAPIGLLLALDPQTHKSSDRPAHHLRTRNSPNPTKQHNTRAIEFRKSSKKYSATPNRQALSFDSNMRWVPSWTLHILLFSPSWSGQVSVCDVSSRTTLTTTSSPLHLQTSSPKLSTCHLAQNRNHPSNKSLNRTLAVSHTRN